MTLALIAWILCAIATPVVALVDADRVHRTSENRLMLAAAGLIFGPFALAAALFKWRDDNARKMKRTAAIRAGGLSRAPAR